MSEFTAIRGVSRTLQALLRETITNDPDPQLNGVTVDLRSPKEMREAEDTGVSLWLYQIKRNEFMLNQPAGRPNPAQAPRQPLPLNLFYLVSPLMDQPDDEQALIGRVLQTFNDNYALTGAALQDSLQGEVEELRVTLEQLTLEELTRVWYSLQEPYQLSVTYEVQVIFIDSARAPLRLSPVEQKDSRFAQIQRADRLSVSARNGGRR
jgi:hypothetical protein